MFFLMCVLCCPDADAAFGREFMSLAASQVDGRLSKVCAMGLSSKRIVQIFTTFVESRESIVDFAFLLTI
jgi:hypothetical protein